MTWGVSDLTVVVGGVTALDGVELPVEPGRIHAVVGGDGAGKSTLCRVLAGLEPGRSGEVRLPPRRRIGFVPSDGGVFTDLTVDENLEFVADAHGLRGWHERADRLLTSVGLGGVGRRLAGHLSGGQRRKLAGSMAMLAEPALLVLDEVTTGVDPVSRMDLWRSVSRATARGTAVVAATTYLDEAERAGHVTLLHRGNLLASGAPAEIVAAVPGTVQELDEPVDRRAAWRHGRRWRQWSAAGSGSAGPPTLEDAAIVHELLAEGRLS